MQVCTRVHVCVPVQARMRICVSVNVGAQDKDGNTLASTKGSKRRRDLKKDIWKSQRRPISGKGWQASTLGDG